MTATIVQFPSGGPPGDRGDRGGQRAAPARQVVEIVGLDGAFGHDEDAFFRGAVRVTQTLFVPPDGADGAAKRIGQLLLAPALRLSPFGKLHRFTCRYNVLPKWLYEAVAIWQYANMAKGQIVYIRRVANDDAPSNRIQELIEAAGINQAELARRANVTVSSLNKVIKGTRGLDQEWMRRLAPHLGVTPAELLPVEDNPLLLSDTERAVIERMRQADAATRSQFSRVADALLPYTGQSADAA